MWNLRKKKVRVEVVLWVVREVKRNCGGVLGEVILNKGEKIWCFMKIIEILIR